MLSAVQTNSTEAAYDSFRVVEIAPMQLPIGVFATGAGDSMSLSFTYNAGERYIIYASETPDASVWFPIGEFRPGQDETKVHQHNDEDIATVVVPRPFMSHFNSGRGFVRVASEPEAGVAVDDWIPIQGLVNNGDHITLTFISEPFREYIIEGADSPVAKNWIPVDIYGHENSIEHIKIPSQGEITTVEICNPILEWIPENRGWMRIRRYQLKKHLTCQHSKVLLQC